MEGWSSIWIRSEAYQGVWWHDELDGVGSSHSWPSKGASNELVIEEVMTICGSCMRCLPCLPALLPVHAHKEDILSHSHHCMSHLRFHCIVGRRLRGKVGFSSSRLNSEILTPISLLKFRSRRLCSTQTCIPAARCVWVFWQKTKAGFQPSIWSRFWLECRPWWGLPIWTTLLTARPSSCVATARRNTPRKWPRLPRIASRQPRRVDQLEAWNTPGLDEEQVCVLTWLGWRYMVGFLAMATHFHRLVGVGFNTQNWNIDASPTLIHHTLIEQTCTRLTWYICTL